MFSGTAPTTRSQKVFFVLLFFNLLVPCKFDQILIRGLAAGRRNAVVLVSMVGHRKRPTRGSKWRKGWELCCSYSRWGHLRWPVVGCRLRSCASLCLWKRFLNKSIFKRESSQPIWKLGCPTLQFMQFFFNIVHYAFDPSPPSFWTFGRFFDRLGGTLHYSKVRQYKA